MKANVVVAEMDPSRVDVACRAVARELIPFFQAQQGAGSAYWMVDRTSGQVLVVTTWEDERALAAVRTSDGGHRASVAGRTGLVVRSITSMDVAESHDPRLTVTAVARWARVTWTGVAASDRMAGLAAERQDVVTAERDGSRQCGSYRLNDAASGATLAVTLWDQSPALDARVPAHRGAALEGLGVVAREATRPSGGSVAPRGGCT